jgi:hypothetical protein
MSRFLGSLFMLLVSLQAFAQKANPADAPSEQASPVVVWVFLVVFIGGCIGFPIYLWWRGRKTR